MIKQYTVPPAFLWCRARRLEPHYPENKYVCDEKSGGRGLYGEAATEEGNKTHTPAHAHAPQQQHYLTFRPTYPRATGGSNPKNARELSAADNYPEAKRKTELILPH